MKVVDDHQAQVLHPTALGIDIGHGDSGVVVNQNGGPAEGVSGGCHALPVLLCQLPGDQLLVVNKALAGDEAEGQLFPAHFKGEEGHFFSRFFARVQQNIQGHGGLAHAGPGGQQDEVGFVQSGDGSVQILQTGGQAGNGAVAGG